MTGDNKKRASRLSLSVRKARGGVSTQRNPRENLKYPQEKKVDTLWHLSVLILSEPTTTVFTPTSNHSGEGSIFPPPLPSVFKNLPHPLMLHSFFWFIHVFKNISISRGNDHHVTFFFLIQAIDGLCPCYELFLPSTGRARNSSVDGEEMLPLSSLRSPPHDHNSPTLGEICNTRIFLLYPKMWRKVNWIILFSNKTAKFRS